MEYTLENISCAYIEEVERGMDYSMYGIECINEARILQLECDLFIKSLGCDLDYCYTMKSSSKNCNNSVSCNLSLINLETPDVCDIMTLISI